MKNKLSFYICVIIFNLFLLSCEEKEEILPENASADLMTEKMERVMR